QARAQVLQDVAKGVPQLTAMRAAGISRRSLATWERVLAGERVVDDAGQDVTRDITEAIESLVEELEMAAARFEVSLVTSIDDARLTIGRSGVPEWRAAAWFLENSPGLREQFHKYSRIEVDTLPQMTEQQRREQKLVRNMSDAELLEGLDAEWRDLVALPEGKDN